MLLRRLKYAGTPGLILRRTYPELYKSHIVKLFEEFPDTRQWYNEQRHEMVFPNRSRLFFGSAEHAKDMARFYSSEFADIMVDEAQEFSQYEIEQLSGSNRCTSNAQIVPKMIQAFMPGTSEAGLPPIGLSYLKRVFIDRELTLQEQKESWSFVQAFSWDNIEWFRKELHQDGIGSGRHKSGSPDCECRECTFYSWSNARRQEYFIERTEYGRKLAALSNTGLRDAWLYGKWDVFQGQYFTNWNAAKHVISRQEARERVKPWHTKWASGDWGFEHPFCILWHAIDEYNRIVTYRELWGREMHETKLGQTIGALSGGDKLVSFPFSWDAGKLSSRSAPTFPKSINQMISDALPSGHPKPHPADSSPGSRIARARLTSSVLDTEIEGVPQWQISEDCEKLIECMPSLLRDSKNPEDVLKVDYSENYIGDDAYDAAAIGLQYKLRNTVKPREAEISERLMKIDDPTHRQIEYMRLQEEYHRQRRPETMHGDWRRRLEEQ
jgi:hypothetical protein